MTCLISYTGVQILMITNCMKMKEREQLKKLGFVGFKTVRELMNSCKDIPQNMGVYVVLRENESEPQFVKEGTGGFFKGKDPNVSFSELKTNWIDNEPVVYIGKAGGANSSATLQKRLGQYLRFGQGEDIGHWGGRYIWQLSDSQDLVICWKTLTDNEPREVEHQMIADFKTAHGGKRPFANLRD